MNDNLLINLNIINKIKKNDKIYLYGKFFYIEDDNILQCINRFFFRNNRKKNIDSLYEFYDIVFSFINENMNSKNKENIYELKNYIEKSMEGLDNLKETYKDDIYISSKIDILLYKIQNNIKIIDDI